MTCFHDIWSCCHGDFRLGCHDDCCNNGRDTGSYDMWYWYGNCRWWKTGYYESPTSYIVCMYTSGVHKHILLSIVAQYISWSDCTALYDSVCLAATVNIVYFIMIA